MSATLINLIIQIVAGALGGNAAGAASKDMSLGTAGNTIAGAIGGGVGGQILTAFLPMLSNAARQRGCWYSSRSGGGRRRRWSGRHSGRWAHKEQDGLKKEPSALSPSSLSIGSLADIPSCPIYVRFTCVYRKPYAR